MLRREAKAYADRHPGIGAKAAGEALWLRIRLAFYARYARSLPLGSPRWHREQERVAQGSAVGIDVSKRSIFYEETLRECRGALFVMPGTYLSYPENVHIGYNVFLNRNVYIVAPCAIRIGDHVMVGPNTVINSGSHKYKNKSVLIRDQGHEIAPIFIGDDVWLGANVYISPGVTIGAGAVVGANSAVTRDVDPYSVVAGAPARPIGARS